MKTTRELNFHEITLIGNALRVASEEYAKDAAATTDTDRIAEQFRRQSQDAAALSAVFLWAQSASVGD